ncbi:protein POF1B-like [Polyodon spathula]|uniref:protein POF1B-like n=1 Tax=Polyodon spathula TaxID=7913 RepID=UPI001B7DB878|nr:protein POF1B-like [Polyodon spathula]
MSAPLSQAGVQMSTGQYSQGPVQFTQESVQYSQVPIQHSQGSVQYSQVPIQLSSTSIPVSPTQLSVSPYSTISRQYGSQLASVQSPVYLTTNGSAHTGNVVYETVQYLVPLERKMEGYVLVDSQPREQQLLSPCYVQNVSSYNKNNVDTTVRTVQTVETVPADKESSNGKGVSWSSQVSSSRASTPPRSPAVSEVNVKVQKTQEVSYDTGPKLDNRFFGVLLAELHRKSLDIYSCIYEHVSKIRSRYDLTVPSGVIRPRSVYRSAVLMKSTLYQYKPTCSCLGVSRGPCVVFQEENEDVEHLIPKGVSDLTKQQISYLLQMRVTSEKSLRLLLTTFSSLREELIHLQDDLRRLESDKEALQRDLNFKNSQAQQYEKLLESVRVNNRQLQQTLKESNSSNTSLEEKILVLRTSGSDKEYRLKELEYSKRVLEQENELLRQQIAGQSNSPSFQAKSEAITKQYTEMTITLREEKDREIKALTEQLRKLQMESSSKSSSDYSTQLRLTELLTSLEQKEAIIKRQEEEIRKFRLDKSEMENQSKGVTKTIITKKYRNQYPILGLLSDEYQATLPRKEAKTIVIERTGEMYKHEYITSP